MTRAEMLERISSQEISEWMAYSLIEPFGQETQYIGPAITSTVLANVNRKKGAKAHDITDFMPQFAEPKKEQTVEQQIQIAEMFTVALGGKDLRSKEGE